MMKINMSTLFDLYPYVGGTDLDKQDIQARDDAEEYTAWIEEELEWDEEDLFWWGETVTFKLSVPLEQFNR